jgi:hypothetical protein
MKRALLLVPHKRDQQPAFGLDPRVEPGLASAPVCPGTAPQNLEAAHDLHQIARRFVDDAPREYSIKSNRFREIIARTVHVIAARVHQ